MRLMCLEIEEQDLDDQIERLRPKDEQEAPIYLEWSWRFKAWGNSPHPP